MDRRDASSDAFYDKKQEYNFYSSYKFNNFYSIIVTSHIYIPTPNGPIRHFPFQQRKC